MNNAGSEIASPFDGNETIVLHVHDCSKLAAMVVINANRRNVTPVKCVVRHGSRLQSVLLAWGGIVRWGHQSRRRQQWSQDDRKWERQQHLCHPLARHRKWRSRA